MNYREFQNILSYHHINADLKANLYKFLTKLMLLAFRLRHQVPSSVARSLDPFLVLQDGNGLYRAASLALLNIIDFWPTLRFLSSYQ